MTTIQRCPACESSDLTPFYEVSDVPVHNSLVFKTAAEARALARGDLKITLCERCGFVFNSVFDPSKLSYSPAYEDQQSFSPTFNAFARRLAGELVSRYDLRDKRVVEIGCGKGDFLSLLCTVGGNTGIGIDPTALPERLERDASERVTFLREFYSEAHASLACDFLCCRHTLEHVSDVGAFTRTVRASLTGNDAGVFFELPDGMRVLEQVAYWDVYYEHCSYFDAGSLARLFRRQDFDVLDVRLAYDGQYLLLDARGGLRPGSMPLPAETTVEQTREAAGRFARAVRATRDAWAAHFDEAERLGKRIAIWGSGSKCVAFLTTLGFEPGENLVVVDVNPHRHGKFMPGLGMEIDAPAILPAFRPDEVIVMNEIYRDEIGRDLATMGVDVPLVSADRTMVPA